MPININACSEEVRRLVKPFHKSCSSRSSYKKSTPIIGRRMNRWLVRCFKKEYGENTTTNNSSSSLFVDDRSYNICANLHRLICRYESAHPLSAVVVPATTNIEADNKWEVFERTREERAFLRKRIAVKSIDGVDRVRVEWNEGMEQLCIPVEDSDDEEEEDDEISSTSNEDKNDRDELEKKKGGMKHVSYNDKFVNDVLKIF